MYQPDMRGLATARYSIRRELPRSTNAGSAFPRTTNCSFGHLPQGACQGFSPCPPLPALKVCHPSYSGLLPRLLTGRLVRQPTDRFQQHCLPNSPRIARSSSTSLDVRRSFEYSIRPPSLHPLPQSTCHEHEPESKPPLSPARVARLPTHHYSCWQRACLTTELPHKPAVSASPR